MADSIITKQELIDAQKDAVTLKDAVNGNETGIVTPRLNDPYPTLPAAIQKIESDGAAAVAKLENTGGFISAPTLTALQAITPEYDYQLARVDATGDEYRWNPALTTTVRWEATGRNFLSESKDYTDNEVAAALTTAADDATTKAQAAESNAKQAVENSLSALSVSLHLLMQAIDLISTDGSSNNAALIVITNNLQASINALSTEQREALNAQSTSIEIIVNTINTLTQTFNNVYDNEILKNTDAVSALSTCTESIIMIINQMINEFNVEISRVSDQTLVLNNETAVLRNDTTALSTGFETLVLVLNQIANTVNSLYDNEITQNINSTNALSVGFESLIVAVNQITTTFNTVYDNEIVKNADASSSLSASLHIVIHAVQTFNNVFNDFYDSNIELFDPEQKIKRSFLFDQMLLELSKLDGFDPKDVGANKYVESENTVFFPAPDQIVRIDVTTTASLPTAKGTPINTVTAINVGGQILKNFGTLEVQGSSSAAFPKKNWTICMFSDEARSLPIPIKLGHMISQEELVWKANFVDNTQSRNLACNKLWQEFVDSRSGFPKNEVDAVNMLNSNLTVENYNGLTYMPTGATGHVDGFQAVVYINNIFYGIGSLNIGKKRDNYNLDKNTQKHIQLEPQGNWSDVSYTNLPTNPTDINVPYDGVTPYFEIRRPSSWKPEAQGYYTRLKNYMALSKDDMQTAGIDNYFNRKNMIDYIILLQVCDLWDHMGKNSLITTWDGNIWNFMPYDLDTVFGLFWTGKIFKDDGTPWRAAENVLIPPNTNSGNTGFFSKCRRIYGADIDARYAALRKAKIIDVDHIVDLCEELLRKFPPALLKAENTKWNTGSNSIYTSLLQTSSIHQIQTWLSVHIPVCDSYFNYTV